MTRLSRRLCVLLDGKEAYALGFELLIGQKPVHPIITDGQTDSAIIRSLLVRHGMEAGDAPLARVPDVMPRALEALVPRLRECGHAMVPQLRRAGTGR